MASSQLDYNGHRHHWVPARSYRFSPYPLPQYTSTTPDQPSSALAPPLHIAATSHRQFHDSESLINNNGMVLDAATTPDSRAYVPSLGVAASTSAPQSSAFSSTFDSAAPQSTFFSSPHTQESDLQDRKGLSDHHVNSPTGSRAMVVAPVRSLSVDHGQYPGRRLVSGKDVFERVQGRFSLLGSSNKYNVTVGEIKRRINPPECLNTSLLGGLLRRGKGKNGGNDLRQKLEAVGLVLPPGRRKATSVSMLTSLVEAEAQDLSSQFNKVCQAVFPSAELARTAAQAQEAHLQRPGVREDVQRNIRASLQLVCEFREMLEHYMAQEERDSDKTDLPMTGLRSFSLITHTFGVPTISGVMSMFQVYLTNLLKCTSALIDDNLYHHQHFYAHHLR